MTTLPHWCSRLTPIKCSNGDCDKCIKASLGKRASRQVIFSLNESSRTRTEPAAAATCSQTATGSWLLSIVFDRAYRNKGFQKRGHCERVRRAFFSPPHSRNNNSLFPARGATQRPHSPVSIWLHKVSRLVWFALMAGELKSASPGSGRTAREPLMKSNIYFIVRQRKNYTCVPLRLHCTKSQCSWISTAVL